MLAQSLWLKAAVLSAALCALSVQPCAQEAADQARLAAILKKSAEYCSRLERAALDFICFEEVTEETVRFTRKTTVYLYDYQFVRKDKKAQEKRELISVDGQKSKDRKSSLQTVMFLIRERPLRAGRPAERVLAEAP